MTEPSPHQSDALLLVLSEREILDVAAIVGLRARPSVRADIDLIEAFLDSDLTIGNGRPTMLLSVQPDVRDQ